jgi:hypothetical protein
MGPGATTANNAGATGGAGHGGTPAPAPTPTPGTAGTMAMGDVPPEHQALRQKLEKMNGAAFDRAYVDEMVKSHEKGVAEFERAAQSTTNTQLRGFVEKTLPVLRQHLEMAQQLRKEVATSR